MADIANFRVMVFAAGFGTRMKPLTLTTPKPLIEVAGKPLLAYSLDMLADAGAKKAIVNVHYLPKQLIAYLKTYTRLDVLISREDTILETGGGLLNALPLWPDAEKPFLTLNSDIIFHPAGASPVEALLAAWQDDMDALLGLQPLENTVGYDGAGDFYLQPGGHIARHAKGASHPYVFSGLQILHPRAIARLPQAPCSLNTLYPPPESSSETVYGVVNAGSWLHVGTPESIALAEAVINS